MSGLQQSSSRISANSNDARFANSEKTLNEINNIVNNDHMNATVDPNKPKRKQDFTRLCTYCKKSSHTMKFCWSKKKKRFTMEKAPHQPKETFSQKHPNQQKLPNLYRLKSNDHSIAQQCRSDISYVADRKRSRSNNYFGFVRFNVRPDKVNSLYDTLQSLSPLNKSSLQAKKVRNQITLPTYLELECAANIYYLNYSNTLPEIQMKTMALALSFFILAKGVPLSTVTPSEILKKIKRYFSCLLRNNLWLQMDMPCP